MKFKNQQEIFEALLKGEVLLHSSGDKCSIQVGQTMILKKGEWTPCQWYFDDYENWCIEPSMPKVVWVNYPLNKTEKPMVYLTEREANEQYHSAIKTIKFIETEF